MFNFTAEFFIDNQFKQKNFADHIKNKTVLICPCVKIMQKPTLKYLQYLDRLLDTPLLDEIIILNSNRDKFFHAIVQSWFPRLTTVSDNNQSFIPSLKHSKNVKNQIDFLVKHWQFQQLVSNAKEIAFYQQPLENQWTHLLENKPIMQKILQTKSISVNALQKLFKNKDNSDIWTIDNYDIVGAYTKEGDELVSILGPLLWYFALIHNFDLESKLQV